MSKEIDDLIQKNAKEQIAALFQGKETSVEVYLRPGQVIDILTDEYSVEDNFDDFDSNGWQWDFWLYFKHNDKNYVISGDGYYSNTINISET